MSNAKCESPFPTPSQPTTLQLLAAPQALGETCPELPSIRAGSRDQTPNALFAQGQHENSLVSGSINYRLGFPEQYSATLYGSQSLYYSCTRIHTAAALGVRSVRARA
jgi:hypothetical protein